MLVLPMTPEVAKRSQQVRYYDGKLVLKYAGQFYDKVVPTVIEKLGDLLLRSRRNLSLVPGDWRTKKPTVPQWFASV